MKKEAVEEEWLLIELDLGRWVSGPGAVEGILVTSLILEVIFLSETALSHCVSSSSNRSRSSEVTDSPSA